MILSQGRNRSFFQTKNSFVGFKILTNKLGETLGSAHTGGTHTHTNLLITQKNCFSLGVNFIFRLKDGANSENQMNLDWKQAERPS